MKQRRTRPPSVEGDIARFSDLRAELQRERERCQQVIQEEHCEREFFVEQEGLIYAERYRRWKERAPRARVSGDTGGAATYARDRMIHELLRQSWERDRQRREAEQHRRMEEQTREVMAYRSRFTHLKRTRESAALKRQTKLKMFIEADRNERKRRMLEARETRLLERRRCATEMREAKQRHRNDRIVLNAEVRHHKRLHIEEEHLNSPTISAMLALPPIRGVIRDPPLRREEARCHSVGVLAVAADNDGGGTEEDAMARVSDERNV